MGSATCKAVFSVQILLQNLKALGESLWHVPIIKYVWQTVRSSVFRL